MWLLAPAVSFNALGTPGVSWDSKVRVLECWKMFPDPDHSGSSHVWLSCNRKSRVARRKRLQLCTSAMHPTMTITTSTSTIQNWLWQAEIIIQFNPSIHPSILVHSTIRTPCEQTTLKSSEKESKTDHSQAEKAGVGQLKQMKWWQKCNKNKRIFGS